MGFPITELVQSIQGGNPTLQGTWVHPQVAIHLAQWLSPKFAVQVTKWVFDWMSGKVPGGNMPYHLRRYMANLTNVPAGHFSILNEVTLALIAPLEQMGYTLPQSMVPDISLGRMFSGWLRENGYDPDNMPRYNHHYEDGRIVDARAYCYGIHHTPNSLSAASICSIRSGDGTILPLMYWLIRALLTSQYLANDRAVCPALAMRQRHVSIPVFFAIN